MKKSIPSPTGKAMPAPPTMQAAVTLFQAGKRTGAETICQQILEKVPDHFDALHLLGVLKAQAGEYELSLSLLDQAISLQPKNQEVQKNRRIFANQYSKEQINKAAVLHEQGRLGAAEALYLSILKLDSNHFDALQLMGALATQRKIHKRAISYLDRALAIRPDYAEGHYNRGNALQELKRLGEAVASYDQALRTKPDFAEALNNRGNALKELKRLDEAVASCDQALRIKPDFAQAHYNRGNALQELKRLDEAVASYDQALKFKPDHFETHNNRGNALRELKRLDEAVASYDQALRIKPDYAEAHFNRSLANLLLGNLAEGWDDYEWRWQRKNSEKRRHAETPLWDGVASLDGKTILIWSEQGFGDTLQFCRYAQSVASLGARVMLEVRKPLKHLIEELEGVRKVYGIGDSLPAFDYQCPMLSLPRALRTTPLAINGAPYISTASGKPWVAEILANLSSSIGVAWSGSSGHRNDANRSLPFARFQSLLPSGMNVVCLQKDIRDADRTVLANHPEVRIVDAYLRDFTDTAALIQELDLVITVDTSVAHLAGAMGKEVWILLPWVPDWRWLLDRSDSPWYDSATLFRQPMLDDWGSVFADVRQRLCERYGLRG